MVLDEKLLQIGEMPKAEYLREAKDTTGNGNIQWIGVRAYDIDQELGDFLWWKNFRSNLNNPTDRYNTAAFIARLKLETDVRAVIGPAVDLQDSNQRGDYVATVKEPNVLGIYVEADKRPMFNFMSRTDGIRSEAKLRAEKPVEFDEIFQKAKAVLPRND